MFTENLAEFTGTSDFAEAVTIGGVSGNAIFDAAYAEAMDIVATQPSLLIAHADFPLADIDDAVSVRGVAYSVVDMRPDGTGMTRLILEAD